MSVSVANGRSRRAASARARARGFTLVELMAVVAIMAILAALGINAIRRMANASDALEAQSILRSIGVAEERYRSLNQTYLDVSSSPTDASQGWYPANSIPKGQKMRFVNPDHADYNPGDPSAPARKRGWRHLNVPAERLVEFVFKVNAGLPTTSPATAVALATPAVVLDPNGFSEPWYVAQARADANGDGVFCVVVATSFSPVVRVVNDGE